MNNDKFNINEFITQPIDDGRYYHYTSSCELEHMYMNQVKLLDVPDDFKINKTSTKVQYHTKDMEKVRRKQKLAKKAKRHNRKNK